MTEWEMTRLPRDLFNEVTKVIEKRGFWTSENEFVRDAVREKLAKIVATEEAV